MDKKSLSEADIRTKFITPAIINRGWDQAHHMREEFYFTKGRVIVRGQKVSRGKAKKADYILYYKPNMPIAIVEAKDNKQSVGSGMQQALGYAETLDIPFVYSSNGDGFLEHDRTVKDGTVEREISIDNFPTPDELWDRWTKSKGLTQEELKVTAEPYYDDLTKRTPRYYQLNAINRTVEAIAKGQKRLLLVMATGTGKTYTAFQIIWRLWKSGTKKRILLLVDRNILANQTMVGDFKPFKSAMAKLSTRSNSIETNSGQKITLKSGITQDKKVDKSYEIYLSLYQAVSGTEEEANIYKQFSPDFFDLVVVDECHRGSAAEDSAWRKILEYFSSATQIGLTATPKETKDVSNIDYFGEPLFTYTLKDGIDDGFLAPYKVIRVNFDKDQSWRPEKGKKDKFGNEIEDREYNRKDYDKSLVLTSRTEAVAARVTEYLKGTDRMSKTIIFCQDIDHAERMRTAMVNLNGDLVSKNSKYVMRITGDNDEGKAQLDNFIDPEEPYPVIATTSQLMSTGVDAQTCKLIVLDKEISSMTEFKQIIGRGTRINEDYGKFFFTILDFRDATRLFADKDFDGPPIQVYEPGEFSSVVPPPVDPEAEPENTFDDPDAHTEYDRPVFEPEEGKETRKKYIVDDVEVTISVERVQYLDSSGKLVTESLKDFTKKTVRQEYRSLDEFLTTWTTAEKKMHILEQLAENGVYFDDLAAQVGKDYDAFDLICHVAYDQKPLTRRERANNVKKRDIFTKYKKEVRAVLEALLDKFADGGITSVESTEILKLDPFVKLGTPMEILKLFGGKEAYTQAIQELESALYQEVA